MPVLESLRRLLSGEEAPDRGLRPEPLPLHPPDEARRFSGRQRNESCRVAEREGELPEDGELSWTCRGRQALDRDNGKLHPAEARLPSANEVLRAENRIQQDSRLEV